MTDRCDRIADTIARMIWDCDSGCVKHGSDAVVAATAVLDALKDELIPELPDNWWSIELYKSLDEKISRYGDDDPGIPVGHVYADMWDDHDGEILSGTGPTIPTAIRNALEDGR